MSLSLALVGAVHTDRGPRPGVRGLTAVAALVAVVATVTFIVVEVHSSHPMVPLSVFRSRQFSGANVVTLFVYAALGATTFLFVVHLQQDLGYSALAAGAALLPITALMLGFSTRSAGLAQRTGPRPQMTIGPIVIGVGLLVLGRVAPGDSYGTSVLPGVVVLGCGLTLTVAPLTAAVIAAIDVHRAGLGSAINNAVARIAGLLAVAVIPAAAGITELGSDLADRFDVALTITAALALLGGVVAFATIRRVVPLESVPRSSASAPAAHLPPVSPRVTPDVA